MDLTTNYLGFELPHPFMPGASPMATDLDHVKKLEDAGAAAIVMNSLFEEQIIGEGLGATHHMDAHNHISGEASSFFPEASAYRIGPEDYLNQIRKIKEAVKVPVISSLNGSTVSGWLDYAKLMKEAGADAIELNLYMLATDLNQDGQSLEKQALEVVKKVKGVGLPVAVKLSPFYSSLAHFAKQLDEAGADALVLFNRFYQPDFDLEELEVNHTLHLSTSSELLLRLRWLAILSGRVKANLAVTGGVHTAQDAIKAVMAGAHAVQCVSALLARGPEHLTRLKDGVSKWLEENEYESLKQMQGSMGLEKCSDPRAYERANYIQMLNSWKGLV